MKAKLLVLGAGLLAASFAVAQEMPANNADQNTQTTSHTHQTANNTVRGCLSGSAGNFTVTDQNGVQYRVVGDETALQGKAGHEVEITTRENQDSQTTSQGDHNLQQTTNTVQVSDVRDVGGSCASGNSMDSSPMKNDNSTTPQGTPDAAEPPQAQPQTMAMLQQESKPDVGTNSPQQTTPPVSSQTPATPGASTSSTQQQATSGNSTTTSSTTTTTNTSSGQQGSTPSNTNGMNANPSATGTSTSTSTTNTTTQQPQANTNDQNKPLYERQATDIPWANHSGTNSANPPATTPDNSNTGATTGSSNPPQ